MRNFGIMKFNKFECFLLISGVYRLDRWEALRAVFCCFWPPAASAALLERRFARPPVLFWIEEVACDDLEVVNMALSGLSNIDVSIRRAIVHSIQKRNYCEKEPFEILIATCM